MLKQPLLSRVLKLSSNLAHREPAAKLNAEQVDAEQVGQPPVADAVNRPDVQTRDDEDVTDELTQSDESAQPDESTQPGRKLLFGHQNRLKLAAKPAIALSGLFLTASMPRVPLRSLPLRI